MLVTLQGILGLQVLWHQTIITLLVLEQSWHCLQYLSSHCIVAYVHTLTKMYTLYRVEFESSNFTKCIQRKNDKKDYSDQKNHYNCYKYHYLFINRCRLCVFSLFSLVFGLFYLMTAMNKCMQHNSSWELHSLWKCIICHFTVKWYCNLVVLK